MSIEKIKIVKSDLEKLFDETVPDWKKQTLYKWQYGENHPEELETERLYDLRGYTKKVGGDLTIYAKKGGLIIEVEDGFGHTNVLTNMKPSEGFDPGRIPKEITINRLDILY